MSEFPTSANTPGEETSAANEPRHVSFSSVVDAYENLAERENAVIAAARDFVATTSYYRQRKESRETFERLAFALLDLRREVGRDAK